MPLEPSSAFPLSLLRPVDARLRVQSIDAGRRIAENLNAAVGKPYYEREGIVLYHADCRVILQAMAERGIDVALTVTSPPYNIGKEYEEPLPLSDYLRWCVDWAHDVARVTRATGALWVNLGYVSVEGRGRAVPLPYLLWDRIPFYLQQEVVWHYGAGVATKRVFSPRNEKWLFFTKSPDAYVFQLDAVRDPNVKYPRQRKNGKLRCNPLGKNPSDVWQFPKVTSGSGRRSRERTAHPAQFPLSIVDRTIKVSSHPGDVVLDPFSGSGSTGIAAIGNGRSFIGIEIRDDYCKLAADRFEDFLCLRRCFEAELPTV